jgi:hypothetical protein
LYTYHTYDASKLSQSTSKALELRQNTGSDVGPFYHSPKEEGVPHFADVKCAKKDECGRIADRSILQFSMDMEAQRPAFNTRSRGNDKKINYKC